MVFMKRVLNISIIALAINIFILIEILEIGLIVSIIIIALLFIFLVKYNIIPIKRKTYTIKLTIMTGGCELIGNACMIFFIQTLVYLYIFVINKEMSIALHSIVINSIVCVVTFLIILWNGLLRIVSTSSQVGIVLKVAIFFVWWVPILNFIIFVKCCRITRREYLFEVSKIELNNQRVENAICKTKYPILLVHGIFWRDWQYFSYWGRIPRELTKNGAVLYYGNQHSAATMDICGSELKDQILTIIEAEQCEKVNIIGHSKGGLDARYVISCLGMDKYVASLTTIGTPHKGSILVDYFLKRLPDKLVQFISNRYNAAYKRLGDKTPDFYSGVYDLTTNQSEAFNEKAVNKEGVVYQSVASKMNSMFSAGFPLNLGHIILKGRAGINDGFVTLESSKFGDYLGCWETKKTRGVSHGDMIDLLRENIHEFDICEVYVDIVRDLKAKGL